MKFATVCIILVIAFLSATANLFTFLVIIKRARLRNVRSNKHVMNVLIAHFAINITFIAQEVIQYALPCYWRELNDIQLLPYLIYIFGLTTLAIDRFTAIIHPFKYINLSVLKQRLLLIASWLLALFVYTLEHTLRLDYNRALDITTSCSLFSTTVVIITTNAIIFRTVQKQSRKINVLERANLSNRIKTQMQIREDLRLVYACFGAAVTLIILTTPVLIGRFFLHAKRHEIAIDVLNIIASLNSWCDLVCFLFFNKTLRVEWNFARKQCVQKILFLNIFNACKFGSKQ